ncbi:acetate kinase [Enterococcus sp. DIV1298c]|uniref:Acetate kinase n=1 Tax=Candidatus Enterococcus mangumiae TaxID=2230878 RepID=A0ABZ2SZI3_9ENTE|nr:MULTISPECIES: acetate kinase [unclassified Enterococcus]MBO0462023.1 acetate kinase [Enterococcus sp. DIV1298c]MBO0491083.1 acetate kinase [Enterococcus sp. DIV1094]
MKELIIAINSGSSSLKFQVYEFPEEKMIAKGLFERIGLATSMDLTYSLDEAKNRRSVEGETHEDAVKFLLEFLLEQKIVADLSEITGVGHRVAHGGEFFKGSCLVDDEALEKIKSLAHLAPLHNPINIMGIEAFKNNLPACPQVAVFDTSFHQTMPEENFLYPIPYHLYEEEGIRRFGFHGTSHQYVAAEAAKSLGKNVEDLKIISCHLGNGGSICAIKNGRSVITSMGFTPLAGIMMGTRCGDIDPSIVTYLGREKQMSFAEIEQMMNQESGFKGVSGISSDARDIEEAFEQGNPKAILAMNMFCGRVKQTIGSYAAELGGLDVLIFTAGIGENSPIIRQLACEGLSFFGVTVDEQRNNSRQSMISQEDGQVAVMVVPTNEERMIVRETNQLIAN